ncbi:DUF4249 domain-containing protein [Bizionia gelidisalsuginis]|uniref:DUF4249 domain-containing protein n=1 Tax=Bizionia gelidisalsuginis TaxID=291188 RepID=A0ABY3M9T2_9FLAO|nr:DUF4249 domain-containing protein [Bizionia gelidisalsuginis]TYC12012.1 DUF4249 domain-containing protein [Bizionia gelidisalsuginis]
MKINFRHPLFLLLMLYLCFNCTDEIPLETESFEDILVVEATLTNALGYQEIKLSRTYLLEGSTQNPEANATVHIQDDMSNNYSFTPNDKGIYVSDVEFEALPDTNYVLFITTSNGEQYQSSEAKLTPTATIDNLYVQESPETDKIEVLVDSNNETSDAQYFRYEYEETFKIEVPYYSNYNAVITNIVGYAGQEFDIELVLKEENEKTCYTTNRSKSILQTSTNRLENNIVEKFPIRTINKDNSLLRERYSIKVKQYVQSQEAYNFYKTVNDLISSESLLSESQPGFASGNLSAVNNPAEKVMGFFEVASVSSQRIYFNYEDLNIARPDYPYDCDLRLDATSLYSTNKNHLQLNYNLAGGGQLPNQRLLLYTLLVDGDYYKYYSGDIVYYIVSPECGDCTAFSSNIKPDFWID